VRSEIVVIVRLFRNCAVGMVEAKEQALIEQLVADASVEAPDIAILHWLSGAMECHSIL